MRSLRVSEFEDDEHLSTLESLLCQQGAKECLLPADLPAADEAKLLDVLDLCEVPQSTAKKQTFAYEAAEADAFHYNAEMLDDPLLPEVKGERVALNVALKSRHVYELLEEAGLRLGYEPNRFGLWSLRRYSISMVVKKVCARTL